MIALARYAMRTRFEIVLADENRDEADLRAAGEEALDEIERAETLLSIYRPEAVLYAVNAQAADHPVAVDGVTFDFLVRAYDLCRKTGGAFDPTARPLLDLWSETAAADGSIPADAEIEAARAVVGMERLVRLDAEAQTVAFAAPGVRLDPGAIGKGWALDRAYDLLAESGVRRALLHGGTSSARALGTPPGADGWRVALQHPTDPDARLAEIPLKGGDALGVSAVHGRTFYAAGRAFGHVLDPRTGHPVTDTLLAAVVARDATEADALSTAALVLGGAGTLSARWLAVAATGEVSGSLAAS
ncbi:MAG TPA: FAD:protein FMN transferase [Armatimonadaceae bacterium]|nr:FAD:protein FMN transferase [Armatimonadaceae bacterium]